MTIRISSTMSNGTKNLGRRGAMFRLNVVGGLADTAEEEAASRRIFPAIIETIKELGYGFKVMPETRADDLAVRHKERDRERDPHAKHTPLESALLARVANAENMARQYKQMWLDEKRKNWGALEAVS